MPGYIHISERNLCLEWRLSRPERGNAIGNAMASELEHALHELQQRCLVGAPPRVLLIKAAPVPTPSGTWIAGGDLRDLSTMGRVEARLYAQKMSNVCVKFSTLPLPVITLIDGLAIGGGAEFALAGDIRLATIRSKLCFRQLQAGLATGYGGARRLVELVGLARSQYLLLLHKTIDAATALDLQLFHETLPDDGSLDQRASQLCAHFSALSPEAVAAQKNMLSANAWLHPGARSEYELGQFEKIWRNPSHEAFLDAFLRRNQP